MCGITGYFSNINKIKCDKYYQAHKLIAHRGPDDEGFLIKQNNKVISAIGDDTDKQIINQPHINSIHKTNLVLGHRRLSIIDLTIDGHQPFSYKELSMVYNGEIYNYLELKKELEKEGYIFYTHTDTEVVLKAYHKWGINAFNKFNGMWSIAIYSQEDNSLILSRDRFGIKPLFFYKKNNEFYFSSEIKYLLEFQTEKFPNNELVVDYLKNNYLLHTEATMFKDIFQVEPSYCLKIDASLNIIKKKYWNLEIYKNDFNREEVEKLLIDSIKLRLRADVKVGAMLSGGVDSSILVGLMDKKLGVKNLETFSAIFRGYEEFSEWSLIKDNVKHLTVSTNLVNTSIQDITEDLDNFFYIHELPMRSLSIYAYFSLCKYIKNNSDIKVVLNGQGADEIFSGYSDHVFYYILSLFEKFDIKHALEEVKFLTKNSSNSKNKIFIKLIKLWISYRFIPFSKSKYFLPRTKKKYKKKFNDIFLDKLNHDLNFSALREYLYYDDRFSMSQSLESRLPYLDFRLVELVYGLQVDKKFHNNITKKILREVGKDYVHKNILDNKIKMGFITPQEYWQKNELKGLFDSAFNDIKINGLFSFLDKNQIINTYERYQKDDFSDWQFIWRVYALYNWKKVWGIRDV